MSVSAFGMAIFALVGLVIVIAIVYCLYMSALGGVVDNIEGRLANVLKKYTSRK
ncbi:MAG: hypothetical protein U9Q03_05270 [Patescibacteria group bacterium]|nr:hypothetical protein [Patescibacteria group bacterium]